MATIGMATSHIGGIAMRRLVFIDDDMTELDDFGRIVEGEYDYAKIHWPSEAGKLFSGTAPDIFVSDLYLPPQSGDKFPTAAQRETVASAAEQVAERLSQLCADPTRDDKAPETSREYPSSETDLAEKRSAVCLAELNTTPHSPKGNSLIPRSCRVPPWWRLG